MSGCGAEPQVRKGWRARMSLAPGNTLGTTQLYRRAGRRGGRSLTPFTKAARCCYGPLMSRIVAAPLLILLVATPALADPPRQFNLECRGFAHTEEPPGKSTGQIEPWFNIYRVDLDKGLWCAGSCDYGPSPVSYASDDEIIFKATNDKLTSEIIQVNRITGKLDVALTFHGTQRDGARKITAKCDRTEFTGLPVAKF